jgi:meiotically up-regulated gene 157 (Mug157) protein
MECIYNLQNDIMKRIENLTTYKNKKFTTIFCYEQLGYYILGP